MTLRLNGSTSGYTEIDGPAVGANNTLVLPTGNGTSGQVLTTNGSGALSWSKLSAAGLGVGLVLKVHHFNNIGSTTTSTSYTNANTILFSYTPVSTSSILVLIASFNAQIANVSGVNAISYHAIGESGSVVGSGYAHRAFSGSGGIGLQSMACLQTDLPNTSTTARSFQMMHAANATGETVTTAAIRMTIMEVAN
jgi:hypothetical protein